MKRIFYLFYFLLTIACFSCKDDLSLKPIDNQKPIIEPSDEVLLVQVDSKFTIRANIKDADGLKSIKIVNNELLINKLIDLKRIYGDTLTNYFLEYSIYPAFSLEEKDYNFDVIVEDLQGNISSIVYVVNTQGDFLAPKFTSIAENVDVFFSEYDFKCSASDNKMLKYIWVKCQELDFEDSLEINQKSYTYTHQFNLAKDGDYNFLVKIEDASNNKVEKQFTVTRGILQDYPKMYLCDVLEEEMTQDVCGVPMLIDKVGQYKYQARYFNQSSGTEIFFTPQKTQLSPLVFGISANNKNQLSYNPKMALPFVLDKANTYYLIDFDIKNSTYQISTYLPSEAKSILPHMVGSIEFNNWDDKGTWNEAESRWEYDENSGVWIREFKLGLLTSKPNNIANFFTVNPNNPYLLEIKNLKLERGDFNFYIHNDHNSEWWDYSSFKCPKDENNSDPEIWVYSGKYKNGKFSKLEDSYISNDYDGNIDWAHLHIEESGNYDVYFDAHLQRLKIVKAN